MSRTTIYRLIHSGHIAVVQIGSIRRISHDEISRLIADHTTVWS